jgi:hypothetical protein
MEQVPAMRGDLHCVFQDCSRILDIYAHSMQSLGIYLRRIWGYCLRNWFWAPLGLVLLINLKLHMGPQLSDPASVRGSVLDQMRFLEPQVHEQGLGRSMQQIFPEGHLFTHALYGLTWCEVAMSPGADTDSALQAKAMREARWAFEQIDSKEGQRVFDTGMEPRFGMFY